MVSQSFLSADRKASLTHPVSYLDRGKCLTVDPRTNLKMGFGHASLSGDACWAITPFGFTFPFSVGSITDRQTK